MDFVREELEKIVRNLKETADNYINELDNCPSGSLLNNKCRGVPRYYHSYYDKNGNWKRIYLSPNDSMIETLARKEYLKQTIPAIQKNIKLLDGVLARYASLDPVDIIQMTRRAYRLLPDQSFFAGQHENELWKVVEDLETLTDDLIEYRCDAHRDWANQDYPKNTHEYRGLHLTSFGLRVRSRGEIVIAEVAHSMGIPFRYDQFITLDDGSTISPDFSFEDNYYDEFYIEYCGMMDFPDYVRRHLIKRGRYEKNAINEWSNIRYIYSKDDSLNAAEVRHILLDWVVPKL